MKIKGSGKNGNWKLEIWLNNEHDITTAIVQLCWETFLLNKAQKQQLHVWRSDLSILVWFVQCSWSNYLLSLQQFFFCHHIAFQLRFIWMTLKSFHSNVEKTGTWLIVIEAWSIIFHSISAPLLYIKLPHTLNCGTNLLTSCCQLCSVEAGATTRNGPQILCVYRYNQNNHILINNLSYYSSTTPFYHTGALEHTKKGHNISQ